MNLQVSFKQSAVELLNAIESSENLIRSQTMNIAVLRFGLLGFLDKFAKDRPVEQKAYPYGFTAKEKAQLSNWYGEITKAFHLDFANLTAEDRTMIDDAVTVSFHANSAISCLSSSEFTTTSIVTKLRSGAQNAAMNRRQRLKKKRSNENIAEEESPDTRDGNEAELGESPSLSSANATLRAPSELDDEPRQAGASTMRQSILSVNGERKVPCALTSHLNATTAMSTSESNTRASSSRGPAQKYRSKGRRHSSDMLQNADADNSDVGELEDLRGQCRVERMEKPVE